MPLTLTDYQELLQRENAKPLTTLVQAYTEWHNMQQDSTIFPRMGIIYKRYYKDAYFILQTLWDTRKDFIFGSRLGYIEFKLRERLGR